jgi:acyl-coenzyme A synthetase/AMP-(fatty) acid ligase
VISPFPGATPCKPGSAALPFFGIKPEIIRDNPDQTALDEDGWLVINRPWPGLMRRFYGAPDRFKSIHFSKFPGTYATGDRAITDADGYFWMMDRSDENIATPKHSPDTAEAEIMPISQPFFAEAAGAACLKTVDQLIQERLPFTVYRTNGEQRTENVTFMTLKMDAKRRDDLISAHRNQRCVQAAYRETPPRNPTVTSRA